MLSSGSHLKNLNSRTLRLERLGVKDIGRRGNLLISYFQAFLVVLQEQEWQQTMGVVNEVSMATSCRRVTYSSAICYYEGGRTSNIIDTQATLS
jgi:hypothetical protein